MSVCALHHTTPASLVVFGSGGLWRLVVIVSGVLRWWFVVFGSGGLWRLVVVVCGVLRWWFVAFWWGW